MASSLSGVFLGHQYNEFFTPIIFCALSPDFYKKWEEAGLYSMTLESLLRTELLLLLLTIDSFLSFSAPPPPKHKQKLSKAEGIVVQTPLPMFLSAVVILHRRFMDSVFSIAPLFFFFL